MDTWNSQRERVYYDLFVSFNKINEALNSYFNNNIEVKILNLSLEMDLKKIHRVFHRDGWFLSGATFSAIEDFLEKINKFDLSDLNSINYQELNINAKQILKDLDIGFFQNEIKYDQTKSRPVDIIIRVFDAKYLLSARSRIMTLNGKFISSTQADVFFDRNTNKLVRNLYPTIHSYFSLDDVDYIEPIVKELTKIPGIKDISVRSKSLPIFTVMTFNRLVLGSLLSGFASLLIIVFTDLFQNTGNLRDFYSTLLVFVGFVTPMSLNLLRIYNEKREINLFFDVIEGELQKRTSGYDWSDYYVQD